MAVPQGWFLPVTPGTRFVSLGGALAANVHGKNHHRRGAIANYVSRLTLVTESGVRQCGPADEQELFEATLGGFGLTGIIQSATLQLIPIESAVIRTQTVVAHDLDDLLAKLDEHEARHEYSVSWVDTTAKGKRLGRGIILLGEHATRSDLPQGARSAPLAHCWAAETGHTPRWGADVVPQCDVESCLQRLVLPAAVSPGGRIAKLLGIVVLSARRYPRLESAIRSPWLCAISVRAARKWRRTWRATSDGASSKTPAWLFRGWHQTDAGLPSVLLPFGMEGLTFGLDFDRRRGDLGEVLNELDAIVVQFGGRVCLSKDARLPPDAFREMYPEYARWIAAVREFSPERRFTSLLAQRLQL